MLLEPGEGELLPIRQALLCCLGVLGQATFRYRSIVANLPSCSATWCVPGSACGRLSPTSPAQSSGEVGSQ